VERITGKDEKKTLFIAMGLESLNGCTGLSEWRRLASSHLLLLAVILFFNKTCATFLPKVLFMTAH